MAFVCLRITIAPCQLTLSGFSLGCGTCEVGSLVPLCSQSCQGIGVLEDGKGRGEGEGRTRGGIQEDEGDAEAVR